MSEFFIGQRVRILEPSFNSNIWGWEGTVIFLPGQAPSSRNTDNPEGTVSPSRYTILIDLPNPGIILNAPPRNTDRYIYIEPEDLALLIDTTHSNWAKR